MMLETKQLAAVVALLESCSLDLASRNQRLSWDELLFQVRAVESVLGVALFEFNENSTTAISPTQSGQRFLARARRHLDRSTELANMFKNDAADRTLRVVTSHYLATYLLIDIMQGFRRLHADTAVRLSVRTELQVLGAVAHPAECVLGFCAPTEYPEALDYIPWFRMDWWLVVPEDHRFSEFASISLDELDGEGLIVFEPGSTGRQHVFEAFHQARIAPNITTQATTTPLIVQMVEAGLGVAILPLLPSGDVTRGRRVRTIRIATEIRAIESGIFIHPQWRQDPDALAFIDFARQHVSRTSSTS